MKAYEWLTTIVKKPETRILSFLIIWVIGGILLVTCYVYYIVSHRIAALIACILGVIVAIISQDIYSQRADLEKWVYHSLQFRWACIEKPLSTVPIHLSWVSLVVPSISMVFIILVLVLVLVLVPYFAEVLWINCEGDINKFGEGINNYISIILVLIFIVQAWIFYQQYYHMKQPLFKAPLLWTLSKSNNDTDCCILLKNGGNVPIFNISYHILGVSVNGRWGYKTIKSKEISKDTLPRLDSGSEKEIFEKPTKKFEEMRLVVDIIAKTLDGHSTRLFFYKARGELDFCFVGVIRT